MPIPAQSIIKRAAEALQDLPATRWSTAELVRHLNDGQREIVVHRPDSTRTTGSIALVAGARQSLPATAAKLIEVIRNTSGTKRAIRQTDRDLLDRFDADWYAMTGVTEIVHFMHDARDPSVFYVYPPAAASGASVEAVYSALPTDITEPADGTTFTSVTGNLSVPDIHANALLEFILFRAYAKDAEYGGNAALAQAHYSAFASALGIEIQATVAVAPKG